MKIKLKLITTVIFALLLFNLIIPIAAIDVSNITVTEKNGQLVVSNVESGVEGLDGQNKQTNEINARYQKYITVISFITGIAALTMFVLFIKQVIKFTSVGTEHWIIRRTAMIGMLWSCIATMLLGSATLILGLFFNAFQI